MFDNEFETKENKIWTKDKIEPQHLRKSFIPYKSGFFLEEWLILNLSLKRGSLRKYKDYSRAFENDEKTDIFSMKADFKSDFSKTQTGIQKPKSGK